MGIVFIRARTLVVTWLDASTDLISISSSDAVLLVCAFPIAIPIAFLELIPLIPEIHGATPGVSTVVTAWKSYKGAPISAWNARTAFHTRLRTAGNTKRIVNEIAYAEKLERVERATAANASVSNGI